MTQSMEAPVFDDFAVVQGRSVAPSRPEAVRTFFATIGRKPPEAYVDLAAAHGGAYFDDDHAITPVSSAEGEIAIDFLFHFDPSIAAHGAADRYAATRAVLPADLVPIASPRVNGEICLDYRTGGEPSVVLFDYDASPGQEVVAVADSFDAFIAAVRPDARPDLPPRAVSR